MLAALHRGGTASRMHQFVAGTVLKGGLKSTRRRHEMQKPAEEEIADRSDKSKNGPAKSLVALDAQTGSDRARGWARFHASPFNRGPRRATACSAALALCAAIEQGYSQVRCDRMEPPMISPGAWLHRLARVGEFHLRQLSRIEQPRRFRVMQLVALRRPKPYARRFAQLAEPAGRRSHSAPVSHLLGLTSALAVANEASSLRNTLSDASRSHRELIWQSSSERTVPLCASGHLLSHVEQLADYTPRNGAARVQKGQILRRQTGTTRLRRRLFVGYTHAGTGGFGQRKEKKIFNEICSRDCRGST